jgi:DUF4097 and DUF4098 domain-containing protein YvlB
MNQEATMHTFATPGPTNLRVEHWQGRVLIRAEETDTTTVELIPVRRDEPAAQDIIDRTIIEQRRDEVVVLMPKVKSTLFGRKGEVEARIVVPLSSNIDVKLGSADLEATGSLGQAKLASGSGDVSLEEVTNLDVKTGSGDVRVGTVSGTVSSKAGSADMTIGTIGKDFDFLTGSGDIEVEQIEGRLRGKAGSGDIEVTRAGVDVDIILGSGDLEIARMEHGKLQAKTGSGDVVVGVANGTAAYLDIMTGSGETRSSLNSTDAPGDGDKTLELNIRTGSGDVVLQRA